MKTLRALLRSGCTLALTLPAIASAYDHELATHIHSEVTGRMDRQYLTDTPPKIDAPELVDALSKGQDILLLDIRTPAEHGVFTLSHPRALWIPLDDLFKTENLDRLPTARQLIDIRFKEEFEAWRVGPARNIPLPELPARLAELDTERLIVTACPHKDRAIIAMVYLRSQGIRAKYLTDGLIGLAENLHGDAARSFVQQLPQ